MVADTKPLQLVCLGIPHPNLEIHIITLCSHARPRPLKLYQPWSKAQRQNTLIHGICNDFLLIHE